MNAPARSETAVGLLNALGAFGIWGLSPLYFKAIRHVPATETVAHRVLWSILLLALIVGALGRWPDVRAAFATRRNRMVFAATTVLIGGNWLLFIWAINHDRVLQASLGYFINPLVNVLLGVFFLRERLSRAQGVAVAIAAAGVVNLIVAYGVFPWVSLALAVSFGLYGLLRKTVQADSLSGLSVETALLAPAALLFLLFRSEQGTLAFARTGLADALLLAAAGVVTAVPLLLFVNATRRLRLATVGLMQYIAPTLQFLLAVLVFRETFTPAHAVTFACIWASLAIYTADSWRMRPRAIPAVVAPERA